VIFDVTIGFHAVPGNATWERFTRAVGRLTGTATATDAEGETASDLDHQALAGTAADLAIVLRGPSRSTVELAPTAKNDAQFSVSAKVTNYGPSAAHDVEAKIAISAEGLDSAYLLYTPTGCQGLSGDCDIGTLAPGASTTFQMTVRLDKSAVRMSGNTTITATGTVGGAEYDPNEANNTSKLAINARLSQ